MTSLTIKTYAQYSAWVPSNPRAPLWVQFAEIARRDPFAPEIPANAFKVTFYDQPDPVIIQGRTATFEKENFSNPVYLGDTVIHPHDLQAHFKDATNLSDYYAEQLQKTPDAQALVKTRTGNYEILKTGDEVMNSKGQTIWPLPVFPLGGIGI